MFSPRLLMVLGLTAAILLSGCSGALRWSEQVHVVEQGDTLYSIAFENGLDYRELAEWNGIGQNYLIFPGDKLALSPRAAEGLAGQGRDSSTAQAASSTSTRSASSSSSSESSGGPSSSEQRQASRSTPSSPPQRRDNIEWQWPVEGEIIRNFGEGSRATGIQIAADEGTSVEAAASGRVVYTGSGLIGYGQLIIVKHDDVYLSAYGHNQDILVEEGDEVERGERIGRVGLGRGNRSMLHFEIRSEGEAVDPMGYLPQ